MKKKHTSTPRRALAILLSLLLALAMTTPVFARGGYEAAVMYVDDLGRDAVNLPVTGHTELDLTDKPSGYTFKVYDDGGRTGNCDHVEKDGWLLIEAPEGFVLQFAGWVNINSYRDYLTVYDGDLITADSWELDNIIYYRAREFGSLVTTGHSMLIHFTGPDLYTCPGFELSVTLTEEYKLYRINVVEGEHGSVVTTYSAQAGATATISVEPDPGYALKSISVRDANGDNMLPMYPYGCVRVENSIIYSDDGFAFWDVDPLWYSGVIEAAFTMPASDVTVEYEMTPISEGLSINLPISGWGQIVIPEEVQTFKIYDDGGPDGEYSMYNDTMATLVAPEGYRIRVTGTAEPYPGRDDCYLTLNDGTTYYDPTLVEITGNSEDHDIGMVESSGRYMFLRFDSGWNEDHLAGIDLTVTLIPDDDYGDPVWTWADDYSSASATFSNGSHTVTLVDAATEVTYTTDPGCETDGIGYYVASVDFGGETYSHATDEDVTIPGTATGHTYGFTGWSWAADHSSAEATFTCEKGDDSFTLSDDSPEMVTVEPAGCLTDANVKYTAQVSYNGEDYTTESDVVADPGTATGHRFNDPEWMWMQDDSNAPNYYARTVMLSLDCPVCLNDYHYTNRDENPLVTLTVESETLPTDTRPGEAVCSATATIDGVTYTDSHTFVLPALAHTHDWGTPKWVWADDYSRASAYFTCSCGETLMLTDESPEVYEVRPATDTLDQILRYTATVSTGNASPSAEIEVLIPGTATGNPEEFKLLPTADSDELKYGDYWFDLAGYLTYLEEEFDGDRYDDFANATYYLNGNATIFRYVFSDGTAHNHEKNDGAFTRWILRHNEVFTVLPTADSDELADGDYWYDLEAFISYVGESIGMPQEFEAILRSMVFSLSSYGDLILSRSEDTGIDGFCVPGDHEFTFLKRHVDVDKGAAAYVDGLIDDIGTVEYTDDCKAKIDAARDAYDALTDAQKELVEKYDVLTAAEDRYAELKAAAETPDEPQDDGLCKWCGEPHTGFWGKIVGFFHSIIYFFAHLFGKR